MPPAVTAAGPRPSVDHALAEGLRAELQQLRHAIAHALPALGYVADDPCQPAQRTLLSEVIADLTDAITTTNGTNP